MADENVKAEETQDTVQDSQEAQGEQETPKEGDTTQKKELSAEESQELKKDIERTGIKESATNEDAAGEADEEDDRPDVLPYFFVEDEDRHRVDVDILYDPKTGKVESVSRKGMGIDFSVFKNLIHTEEWFDFSVPTYNDMQTWRTSCAVYNDIAGGMVVNGIRLRNFLVAWHLKDWSIRDRKGESVKLVFDEDNLQKLSNESVNVVYKVPATIIDVVISKFEKDMMFTRG